MGFYRENGGVGVLKGSPPPLTIALLSVGSLWGRYGAAVGPLWGCCGAAMGPLWGGAFICPLMGGVGGGVGGWGPTRNSTVGGGGGGRGAPHTAL